MKRARGISIDRDIVKQYFEPLLLEDGSKGPLTYSRFVRYVAGRCNVSVNSLKELWMGRTVDESTLKRLRAGTGVDLQRSPEDDRISSCIARLAEVDKLMAGRMFAPAPVTAHIDSLLDDSVADLRWIQPHQHELSIAHQQLICRLAGQAMGSLQMLRKYPSEQLLRDLQAFGMSFAGFVSAYNEPQADQARGWICYNWIGKNWNHWCHPQQLLTSSTLDSWNHKLKEAEFYFRRASQDADTIEAQTLRITSYRNLICSDRNNDTDMNRLRSQIARSLAKSDYLTQAYLLVLDSHRAAKTDDLKTAVTRLLRAKDMYQVALGPSHHFITECDLRLVQLGYCIPDVIDLWKMAKPSKVSCSCIVDLHDVDRLISASRENESVFVQGLKALQGSYHILK
jgi:hypothetical protein